MKQWCVAYTQPGKEMLACQHLMAQGFTVYLPRFRKMRRHARRVDYVLSALFPRYLFVAIDTKTQRWRSVNGTRGISYLLSADDQPLTVPGGVVERLQAQEEDGEIVPLDGLSLLLPGAGLQVVDGPFAGLDAKFEAMDGAQRVQLLLNFLGRETRICLPAHAVEAA